jgi:nucleoside-diphosphate-sugar epimerase
MTGMMTGLAGARVLVTGGCGLIGSRIGRLLARMGAVPVALDRLDAYQFEYAGLFGALDAYQEIHRGDVADPAVVGPVMDGCDYVIHAAAYADVAACTSNAAESTRTNVQGTQVVLDAVMRRRPRRFVYVSSAAVYGSTSPPPPSTATAQTRAPYSGGANPRRPRRSPCTPTPSCGVSARPSSNSAVRWSM